MNTVIKVENLSKKYLISHQNREKYQTLRDTLAKNISVAGRRLLHPLRTSSGQPLEGSGSVEEFWALKDVSFEVKQGERIGIIGRNGAGKSTLLKILSRITEPTAGRISLKGRVASLLEVGTGFHPELTGRENIFLNGAILGMKRAEIKNKFDEIVDFAEVEKFLDTPVKRYSSGMYVRLAFSVAAHLEPEVFIVDEVLAVGDAHFQKKCLGKMDQVGKEGRTVLFVSHNMAAVEHLCDNCFQIEQGGLLRKGPTADVIPAYIRDFSFSQNTGTCLVDGTFIKAVRILSEDDKNTFVFSMGSPFRAEIDLEGICDLPGAQVSLSLVNRYGQRVLTLNTGMVCCYQEQVRQSNETFSLEISAITLVPGYYSVEVGVSQKGISLLERYENIADIEIVGRDVYGTGYKLSEHYGVVYADGKWVVSNTKN